MVKLETTHNISSYIFMKIFVAENTNLRVTFHAITMDKTVNETKELLTQKWTWILGFE